MYINASKRRPHCAEAVGAIDAIQRPDMHAGCVPCVPFTHPHTMVNDVDMAPLQAEGDSRSGS